MSILSLQSWNFTKSRILCSNLVTIFVSDSASYEVINVRGIRIPNTSAINVRQYFELYFVLVLNESSILIST